MRFRLLKKNFIVFLVIVIVFIMLFYTIRRTKDDSNMEETDKESTHTAVMVKFDYGTIQNMRKSIYDSNYRQFIQNGDQFPLDPEVVIVVQVHNRPAYLKMLIQSLEKVTGIQNALVIFSHDYFSEEISGMVKEIAFCRVLQIFFPYSIQLYPNEFPGQDPQDCPRDISKDDAIKKGCLNAKHPDSYGHYREASITQTKHHWWWKLHFVFERVRILRGYNGYVVFIEEDNYLLPDFHEYLKSMSELRKTSCGDCDVLALGNHNSLSGFHELSSKTETSGWLSTKHNIGMGITRELYYKLMGCNNAFCTYDDYNWDWTLQNLSGTCISKPIKVLVALGSRVIHTGDCGLHQKTDCRPEMAQEKVDSALKDVKSILFPPILTLTDNGPVVHQPHMKNGGWGDIRDHTLCVNYAARL
ncbi:alpha-1,6-mannosyl-glycoprotein 2-beta-N-acetylglucosaminyltransferase [Danio rerio]|uniref:Alpha-1,6-mannosyl-glycoprotein 2-beta-N-acetylglucosaminyltransferase n=1 Tax=Danio rerio TaxID=7955 RepID=E7FDN9_DANRE|nr:alpha-1,6-mannosyl-glycoprotein 2-beta-N-acetylglucosaminyltransferase-like [Danio rerio]|eukprot:XP_003200820.1 alpha-1,6-mannosyl-glycoprotein 2-beta-N-acetylglucosaminyltransferase-like [Danio rerio]